MGPLANDAQAHARWQALVRHMRAALGWADETPLVRVCIGTTMLAFRAPADQLLLATDINEWAWEMAAGLIYLTSPDADTDANADAASAAANAPAATITTVAAITAAQADTGASQGQQETNALVPLILPAGHAYAGYQVLHAALGSVAAAQAAFTGRAANQASPQLLSLMQMARQQHVPVLQDDDFFTLGSGNGARTWPLAALPALQEVPWPALSSVPTVLVSGTNGKTTSVRLLAAFARQAGQRAGYCCTEGVFVDGTGIEAGDFSGPGGARSVLRQQSIDFAVLEMARGGILRRGLALDSAEVALITNVSPEHFGEYGVDSLADLADAKLVLAQALGTHGTLVLNADDPLLLARGAHLPCRIALFALDYDAPVLQAQRARGAACCGVQAGRLRLFYDNCEHDLGAIASMPLTIDGNARYNIANCAAAALSAAAIGIAPQHIATVLAQFGQSRMDNPGRLERWRLAGLNVLIDYAHNPEGLSGLLTVAQGLRAPGGRTGLLLGQAGNRSNAAIEDLAVAAASFCPARIVLKDIAGYIRGRAAGEVPALLYAQLLQSGIAASAIETILPEVDAACALLRWAASGDVLVLPVHDQSSKNRLHALLDTLQADGWQCGQPLPPSTD